MRTRLLLTLGLVAAAQPAFAINVFLNDVRLDGGELRGQTLSNVDVRFDEKGDVHIVARGYKVTAEPAKGAAQTAPRPAGAGPKHFYVAPQVHGPAQWDVELYINQVFVKKFRSKDAEPLFEVTRFLRPGTNVFHFVAQKEAGDRQSMSPNDYFELVIGDGELSQGQLLLNKLASYKRTAAEVGPSVASDIPLDLAAAP